MNIFRYYNAISDKDKNKKYAVIKQYIVLAIVIAAAIACKIFRII